MKYLCLFLILFSVNAKAFICVINGHTMVWEDSGKPTTLTVTVPLIKKDYEGYISIANTKQYLSCYSSHPDFTDYLLLRNMTSNIGKTLRYSQNNQELSIGQRVAIMPYNSSTPIDISLDINTSLASRDIVAGEVIGQLETMQINNYGTGGAIIYINFVAGNNLVISTESCNFSVPSTVDFGDLKISSITSGTTEVKKTIQVRVNCSLLNEKTPLDIKIKNPASKYDNAAYETNHTGLGLKVYTSNDTADSYLFYPNTSHEFLLNTSGSASFPLTFELEAYPGLGYGTLSLPFVMSFTLS
ncbi:fimbrial protein [Salmonella enterica]|uniref:fimbrial protein n=1 Tax=Salmonella enterica TaxID=28901 RepID=UPI0009AC6A68|nr:fimbrial protein [Salmonella enterica]